MDKICCSYKERIYQLRSLRLNYVRERQPILDKPDSKTVKCLEIMIFFLFFSTDESPCSVSSLIFAHFYLYFI